MIFAQINFVNILSKKPYGIVISFLRAFQEFAYGQYIYCYAPAILLFSYIGQLAKIRYPPPYNSFYFKVSYYGAALINWYITNNSLIFDYINIYVSNL